MNSNGRGRTWLNDRSAREGSSAEHAALRRAPTHSPAPTRDRERREQMMKTILCPGPVALTSRPGMTRNALTGAHQWFLSNTAVANSP